MDSELNPYSPGSGRRPPELVGREAELGAFDTLVARTRAKRGDRGIVMTGLRGVGKTVLLNEMQNHADRFEWITVRLEARRDAAGAEGARRSLARGLVAAARRLSPQSRTERMKRALSTITAFNATVGATKVSLGVELTPGRGDSGDTELDILELVEDLTTALENTGRAFALFIDEMQDLDEETLGALIAAQHAANQRDWPFFIIGAGLPNLPRVLTEARSYAERLFNYRQIGQLQRSEARAALSEPALRLGASFTPEALDTILDAASGYPYFLQEYGQAIWDIAPHKVFTIDDSQAAVQFGLEHLDAGFFRARWDRATPSERRFLLAMADDHDEPSLTADIARRMGLRPTSLGPYRAQLMNKGLIYSPEHGQVAFTVPGMAAYLDRHHPDVED